MGIDSYNVGSVNMVVGDFISSWNETEAKKAVTGTTGRGRTWHGGRCGISELVCASV